MALQWTEADLPLCLDDFIPPHLQKKASSSYSYTQDQPVYEDDDGHIYKARLVLTSEDTSDSPSPRTQRRWIRYEGIGPTDDDGMPFASRSSVDKPREWYRKMFKVLHPMSDAEDSDSDGSIQAEDQPDTHSVKRVSGFVNKEQNWKLEQNEHPKKDKETNHLHIALKSTINEPPSKISSTSRVPTSVGPSSISFHSTGQSHLVLNKSSNNPRSPPHRSEEPQFTRLSSVSSYSSEVSPSKHSQQQAQANHNLKLYQSPEHSQANPVSSRPSLSPRATDFSYNTSPLTNRGMSSPKSPSEMDKYSSHSNNSSPITTLSPTSRDRRKTTTKVLDQLESELHEFNQELDRDLRARKERTESLEYCEEVILRRSSYREDGSAQSTSNNTQNSRNTDDSQALIPVAQAVVKFDFGAESEKEISLPRGTTVHILKQVDKNWLLGEQNGRRGLFPASYIKVISPDRCDGADTPQLSAVALYDFKADSDVELPLRKGQRVSITRRVDGRWFEGKIEGSPRVGLFPANYVQIKDGPLEIKKQIPQVKAVKSTKPIVQVSDGVTLREKPCVVKAPTSSKLQQLQGTVYRATFPFSPNNSDELRLLAGDVVTVTQRCDDGWYVGVCWRTQEFGTFPGNYVVPYETS